MTQTEHMVESNPNTNNLTVLILAAGYGRRMGPFSRMVNKCLVPYDNKPLISHIFDRFPEGTSFVVACGNMAEQVKDYLSHVHADKKIKLIDIPEFDEGTTGPATTIRYCASQLPDAFMWISCDTLFTFNYENKLDNNWIAVYPVDSSVAQDYCWVERDGDILVDVHNKKKSTLAVDAFIGLMYVKDKTFVDTLNAKNARDVYEGFDNLELKVHTVRAWQDFGTYEKWKQISEGLPEVSFPKPDEIFYADNGKIIKFTTNPELAKLKHRRSVINPFATPKNVQHAGNFLFYDKSPGKTFYPCLTPEKFKSFLDWAESNLWKDSNSFGDTFSTADRFYRVKTLERLEKFRIKYNSWVEFPVVNGHDVKTIEEYINETDFVWLASNCNWKFIHGDLQFDNIIYNEELDDFTAIDWRTDFGGDMYGDVYYDLAKMLGGLYLNYQSIKDDLFSYEEAGDEAIINVPHVENLEHYEQELQTWVLKNKLDWQKVKTLVPIIYLNMAPLHEAPFDKFLIALSQLMFSKL